MSEIDNFMKEANRLKKEDIIRTGKSLDEYSVFCPHCAHEQDDTEVWESGLQPNDSDHEYECDSCCEKFTINARVKFSTYK